MAFRNVVQATSKLPQRITAVANPANPSTVVLKRNQGIAHLNPIKGEDGYAFVEDHTQKFRVWIGADGVSGVPGSRKFTQELCKRVTTIQTPFSSPQEIHRWVIDQSTTLPREGAAAATFAMIHNKKFISVSYGNVKQYVISSCGTITHSSHWETPVSKMTPSERTHYMETRHVTHAIKKNQVPHPTPISCILKEKDTLLTLTDGYSDYLEDSAFAKVILYAKKVGYPTAINDIDTLIELIAESKNDCIDTSQGEIRYLLTKIGIHYSELKPPKDLDDRLLLATTVPGWPSPQLLKKHCAVSLPPAPTISSRKIQDFCTAGAGITLGECASFPIDKWGASCFKAQKLLSPREGLRNPYRGIFASIGYRTATRTVGVALPLVITMITPERVKQLRKSMMSLPLPPKDSTSDKLVATFANTTICTATVLLIGGNYLDNQRLKKQMGLPTRPPSEIFAALKHAPINTYINENILGIKPAFIRNLTLYATMTVAMTYTQNQNPPNQKKTGLAKVTQDALLLALSTASGAALSGPIHSYKLQVLLDFHEKRSSYPTFTQALVHVTQNTKFNVVPRSIAGAIGGGLLGFVVGFEKHCRN